MKITTQVVTPQDAKLLSREVVSDEARLRLTRLLRVWPDRRDLEVGIVFVNRIVNIARAPMGLPVYVLDSGGEEYYAPVEHAWHQGELELAMRRPSTAKLAEALVDLAAARLVDVDDVNEVLAQDGVSFSLVEDEGTFGDIVVSLRVTSDTEIEAAAVDDAHPNIRHLINRMETLITQDDWPGVLHTSAMVFETLAKVVVNLASVENQTLASFFDRYRKDSKLPSPLLDYILEIYKRRNVEPLAGHGQTAAPTVTKEEALLLAELTRVAVRLERSLSEQDTAKGSRSASPANAAAAAIAKQPPAPNAPTSTPAASLSAASAAVPPSVAPERTK